MQSDPEAIRIFMDLLLKHGNPERALRRMNELGVLAAFIPEFEPVVAMMQFNLYHHYTVDEHSIQCVAALAEIERGEHPEDLPLSSEIMQTAGLNRKALYLATLLHDIGKGRPEDHSILGAQIARRIATRFGLERDEIETVEWLVRNHLLMSDVAQKRDISDPRTLRDFAKAVKTRRAAGHAAGADRLRHPRRRARHLEQLEGHAASKAVPGNRGGAGKRAGRAEPRPPPGRGQAQPAPHADRQGLGHARDPRRTGAPLRRLLAGAAAPIRRPALPQMLRGIGPDEIRIDLRADADRDATRAAFVLSDHPGIFSRLAGALSLTGANVVDARTYTTRDGYATAVFWVQDAEGHPFAEDRLPRLRQTILRTLAGEIVAREAFATRDKPKKRNSEFRFPTHVTFDNEGSDIYTIIEVDTRDRPGLLYDLTRTLAANHIQIVSAVIATYRGAGGGQFLRQGYVRPEIAQRLETRSRWRRNCARRSPTGAKRAEA